MRHTSNRLRFMFVYINLLLTDFYGTSEYIIFYSTRMACHVKEATEHFYFHAKTLSSFCYLHGAINFQK